MVSGRTSSMSDTRIITDGEEPAYESGVVLISKVDKIFFYVFLAFNSSFFALYEQRMG